jgi:UDP-N-acetylmuramate--alanine ligase
MTKKNNIVYFLGIGGIGMSALARYFREHGMKIYGYDLTPTPLTRELEIEGMVIHYEEDPKAIPANIDFVVYTPAVPADNKEFRYFVENGFTMKKRSDVLGEISKEHFTVAVAGTHGKTSISMLAAHILKVTGKNVTALVGGISKNYHTNYISSSATDILVLEADEFDRSFLKLSPSLSVISSVDADHLDIYGSRKDLEEAFIGFAGRLKKEGILIHHSGLDIFSKIDRKRITYGNGEDADCTAENIKIEHGKYVFDLRFGNESIENIALTVPGRHYVENALAAALIAFETGVPKEEIKKGLETFEGVVRRFDYRINEDDIVFIDDYAHHPAELKATINAVKELYPGKKITGVFQPHLFSRTADFADEFALTLDNLNEIILLDIYPAREKPIPGITSELILNKISNKNKKLMSKKELLKYLKDHKPEVLLTLGAGDIGLMLDQIEEAIG